MAASMEKFCSCFVLFLCLFCSVCSDSVHVMQQNNLCDDIEGTWEFKSDVKPGVSSYFLITKNGEILRFKTSVDTEKIPFLAVRIESSDPSCRIHHVLQKNFMEEIVDVVYTPTNCRLKLRNGMMIKLDTIKHVHLIYMNHLDVGYNTNHAYPASKELIPGYINNVLNYYFQVYFPRAARLGDEIRKLALNETFIYMTHPWLVSLYLDCPSWVLSGVKLQCPTEAELETFRRAVWKGDIAWHAGPFNTEPESANPELFSYSLTLSQKLDDYFGFTNKKGRTVSNRDVPGWTQAAIPYLVENNIEALSIGVNPSSAPPDVPSPNVWKYGNFSVITYWHKGGYPLSPGPSPQKPGGLSRKDCQFVKGLDHVLCFAFRQDNDGPPENITEIQSYYKILRYEFPGAEIRAATFEDFTKLLIPLKHTFPVVTKEIGDTWIQGPASDPVKMSHYRTISRMRSQCLKSGECDKKDPRIEAMSRILIKLPEHTYGLAMNFDWKNWSNTDFQPRQYTFEGFENNTKNWLSHRQFNQMALDALGNHPLKSKIQAELRKLTPKLPDFSQYKTHDTKAIIKCKNGLVLKVGENGGLIQLTDSRGQNWSDFKHPLGEILYKTYNTTDFDLFQKLYNYKDEVGIWKPGMDYTKAESRFWSAGTRAIHVPKNGDPCEGGIYVQVLQNDMESWFKYGAPAMYVLKYQTNVKSSLDMEYQFFEKISTRLPEALYVNFRTTPRQGYKWWLHKVGFLVDPMNVVTNGSQYVHAVDKGVGYLDENKQGLFIESLDVATVAVQTNDHDPSPFPIPLKPLKSQPTGMAFNVYNNIWETNFIFWYPYQPEDKHYKARFRLHFT